MTQSVDSEPSVPSPDLYRNAGQAEYIDTLQAIGPRQRAFFADQGYLAIRRAFSPAQIKAASQAVNDLIDGNNAAFRGIQLESGADRSAELDQEAKRLQVRKLMAFVEYDRRLKALSADPTLLSQVKALIDGAPLLFQDMALLKPPRIGREKPWHQDCAYFNIPLDVTVVGVWIALDAATVANGCLYLIPGSHRDGPQLHFKRRDWQICDTTVQPDRAVAVPLEPGGCLIWHGLVQHGSPPNPSEQWRRALQFHYKPKDAAELTTEERMGIYGGKVQGAEC